MTSAPLVSVIIPCYNAGRFVRDALDSALAQTYAAVEIVLVNDGSTEDLETTLAPYRNHARVKIIAQTNQGLPAARNRGIRESGGEYLKFLDADDWLAPNALAKQVAAFETQPAPGLVYCDLQRVNAQGEPLDDYAVATARRILNGDICRRSSSAVISPRTPFCSRAAYSTRLDCMTKRSAAPPTRNCGCVLCAKIFPRDSFQKNWRIIASTIQT